MFFVSIAHSQLILACTCAAKGYCSLLVSRSIGLSAHFLSNHVDMWVCATGAQHSKSLERRCPRTACLQWGSKIIYSYYTRYALTRDCQPTAWDGFAHPAETEALCIRKVSPQIVVERFLKVYYECQVRGSFCGRSEKYDVKTIMLYY